jgi:hypothetical protein
MRLEIIILTTLILLYQLVEYLIPAEPNLAPEKVGGNETYQLFIGKESILVFDGHNFLHRTTGFEDLNDAFKIIRSTLPTQTIHFIMKSSNKDILKQMKPLSKKYKIIFHLALDKKNHKQSKHYAKGRDDYLAIRLANLIPDSIIISDDRFRDFEHFCKIPDFEHITVKDGEIVMTEKIRPTKETIDAPTVGNHFIFDIHEEKEGIFLEPDSVFARMYFKYSDKEKMN